MSNVERHVRRRGLKTQLESFKEMYKNDMVLVRAEKKLREAYETGFYQNQQAQAKFYEKVAQQLAVRNRPGRVHCHGVRGT